MIIKAATITTGEIGMRHQALGLARCLSNSFEEFVVTPPKILGRLPSTWLPKRLLSLPNINDANVIITCGRRSVAYSLALKQNNPNLFTVHIQNPQVSFKFFDLVVPMQHDQCEGPNVLSVKTALHHLEQDKLELASKGFEEKLKNLPDKKIVFILGGNTKDYEFTQDNLNRIVEAINRVKQEGYGVLLSTARRTPKVIVEQLKRYQDEQSWFYLGEGENPYLCFLNQADGFIATSDSVSMVSEMLFTGKPIYLMDLDGFNKRLMRFKQNLIQSNMVREWQNRFQTYSYQAPDSKQEVAALIKQKLTNM